MKHSQEKKAVYKVVAFILFLIDYRADEEICVLAENVF